ncbi:MAG: type pantothenate kinase [Bacteroidetes bacterium]|nr:type pantothenate kinase [Bacteroidota bacterium]
MHLAIDIGNTALKFALFDGERMTVKGAGIEALETELVHHASFVTGSLISSVTDQANASELLKKLNIPFSTLSARTPLPIANLYRSPDTLGADRITLAVAVHHLFAGAAALVIGAGTCITYDLVEDGNYHGGAISPGITMRFRALHDYTSRLPLIDWGGQRHEAYETITGTDSQSSIMTGVLKGALHEIDGTIEAYKSRYSGLRVAVTGGDMDFLVKNLKNDIFARPDMVLEGLNYILLHNA